MGVNNTFKLFYTHNFFNNILGNTKSKYGLINHEVHVIFGYTKKLFYRDLNKKVSMGDISFEVTNLKDLVVSGMNKFPFSPSPQYRGWRLYPEKIDEFDEKFKQGNIVESSFWFSGTSKADAYPTDRNFVIEIDENGRRILEEIKK